MARKRERMKLPIPTDWDGKTWDVCPLFFPDSPEWRYVVRGHLEALRRGWGWDEKTGDLKEALHVSKLMALAFMATDEILSLPELEDIMACWNNITDKLTDIEQAILAGGGGGGMDEECCEALVTAITGLALPGVLAEATPPQPGDDPQDDIYTDEELEGIISASNDPCGYLYGAVDGMRETMHGLAPIVRWGWVGLLLAGPIILLAAWWGLVAVAFATTVVSAMGMWGGLMRFTESELNAAGDYLQENRDDIVCEAHAHAGNMSQANYASDLKLLLDGLRLAYPVGPAKVLALFLYTNGLAAKHATMEWEALPCPNCEEVDGCGGISWYFGSPFPSDCWEETAGFDLLDEGAKACMFPTDTMTLVHEWPFTAIQSGSYLPRVRFMALGMDTTNHHVHVRFYRRLVDSGGAWVLFYNESVNTGAYNEWVTDDMTNPVDIDKEVYEYLLDIWLRSQTGAKCIMISHCWLNPQ